MHAFTNMILTFPKAIDSELHEAVYDTIAGMASDVDLDCTDNSIEFEESYRLVWLEDLVDAARKLSRLCKGKTSFTMSGTIDTSESAGEYMDYRIEFKEDMLKVRNSPWYLVYWGTNDWNDSYEDFCEQFDKEEDVGAEKHTYSEEFFKKLRVAGEWYSTNGFGGKMEIWLDGIHLGEFHEVPYNE